MLDKWPPSSRQLIVVERKEVWLSNSHIPPFISLFHPVPSPIVHRASLFICHHGMQNATNPGEKTSNISCCTPPFTVIFGQGPGILRSYILIPRDIKCPSRQLVHWTRQALVPNVSKHVIVGSPYQSHSMCSHASAFWISI